LSTVISAGLPFYDKYAFTMSKSTKSAIAVITAFMYLVYRTACS